jgi:hypothetical protein
MPIEVLNINRSRNARRSLFDYPCEALVLIVEIARTLWLQ